MSKARAKRANSSTFRTDTQGDGIIHGLIYTASGTAVHPVLPYGEDGIFGKDAHYHDYACITAHIQRYSGDPQRHKTPADARESHNEDGERHLPFPQEEHQHSQDHQGGKAEDGGHLPAIQGPDIPAPMACGRAMSGNAHALWQTFQRSAAAARAAFDHCSALHLLHRAFQRLRHSDYHPVHRLLPRIRNDRYAREKHFCLPSKRTSRKERPALTPKCL